MRSALLLAVALAASAGCAKSDPVAEAQAQCKARYDNLMRWISGRGATPQTEEELHEAADNSALDPWGNPYEIVEEAGQFRVWSSGPDGKKDTEDDVCYPPVD